MRSHSCAQRFFGDVGSVSVVRETFGTGRSDSSPTTRALRSVSTTGRSRLGPRQTTARRCAFLEELLRRLAEEHLPGAARLAQQEAAKARPLSRVHDERFSHDEAQHKRDLAVRGIAPELSPESLE